MAAPVRAQRPGDANCDGSVTPADAVFAAQQIFTAPPLACAYLDGNGDGVVSAADLPAIAAQISAPLPVGPEITFLGLAAANGTPWNSSGSVAGAVMYQRPAGQGFKLVVEARPGSSGVAVGQSVFASDPRDPTVRPDLWVVVSQPLGDGSPAVCEGGVPAVVPADFRPARRITDAINDLACNFAVATAPAFACTSDRFGRPAFVSDDPQVQFCLQVTRQWIFPDGETLVTVAVRDRAGNLGPWAQLRLRVGPGPFLPTPTGTPTNTATVPTVPRPPTATPTPSASRTPSPTMSPTRTSPSIASATPTASATRSTTPTATISATATTGDTRSPVVTVSPTQTWSPTVTVAVTSTPTRSATSPSTATPTRTWTVGATRSPTPSGTPTPSRTRTPTRSPTAPPGPIVRYFGLTRSDDTLVDPSGTTPDGIPIFARPQGFGFNIVVEAARGPSGNEVGGDTFVPDLSALPDLQIIASRPLGDGSDAVCDQSGPNAGGVPGMDPPSYLPTESVIRVLNDFGCRFIDGSGNPRGRGSQEACTRVLPDMDFRFVMPDSALQFCAPVTRALEFPPGDTVLTVRVLDQIAADAPPGSGVPGPTARIVVRVLGGDTPVPTATVSPTPTRSATRTRSPSGTPPRATHTPGSIMTATPTRSRTPSVTPTRTPTTAVTPTGTPTPVGPVLTYFGIARADGSLVRPAEVDASGIPVFVRPLGAGFMLVVEAKPGAGGAAVGQSTFQSDLSGLPDLQIVASRPLGNGSSDVCDYRLPNAGGVPAVDPPSFDSVQVVNDLSCRFRDGADEPRGRALADACVLFDNGAFGFARADSTVQFCALVDRAWAFPSGDTVLTVRVRDTNGNLSAVSQIVIRVGS